MLGSLSLQGQPQTFGDLTVFHQAPPWPCPGWGTGTVPGSASNCSSLRRAFAVWLLTVPTDSPSAAAVSASDRSS